MELRCKESWKDKPVIVGFPGMGLVGTIAVRHLVEFLGLHPTGYIHHPLLPPAASIKNGVIQAPIRIYTSEKLVAILSEATLPEPALGDVARTIVERAKKDGAKYLISIAGVVIPGGGEGVYGAVSQPDLLDILKRFKINPIDKGMTTGISATLLLEGLRQGFPVLLLLGLLRLKEDFRAAADVVLKLDEMLKINVDVNRLLQEAERIEREVAEMQMHVRRMREEAKYAPGPYG